MRESILAAMILLAPLICVWRFKWIGVLLGALIAWLVGIVPDLFWPNPDPESGPIRDLWLRYGWAAMLFYATLLFIAKWAYRKIRPPTASPPL